MIYFVGSVARAVGLVVRIEDRVPKNGLEKRENKYDMNIVSAGIIQVLFNTIILVMVFYFYFHENLTALQVTGVILGVISIYLIK